MSNSNLSVSRNKSESTSSTSAASDDVKTFDMADQADVTAFQSIMEKKKDSGSKNQDNKKDSSQTKTTLSDLFNKEVAGKESSETTSAKTGNDNVKEDAASLSDVLKKEVAEKKSSTEEDASNDMSDSSLSGALGTIAQQGGQSVSNVNVSSDAKEVFSKISNEIVAKMIATSDALDAKHEVSISFKNDVLPGTEAIISKNGNRLSVSFVTNVDKSEQIILQNSNDLQSLLSEKLKGTEVVISVKQSNNTNSDTGDGRSRNKYYSDQQQDDDQKK